MEEYRVIRSDAVFARGYPAKRPALEPPGATFYFAYYRLAFTRPRAVYRPAIALVRIKWKKGMLTRS